MTDLIRKPIKGFPNYEVDALGNVYSIDRDTDAVRGKDGFHYLKHYKGRPLKPGINIHGYPIVIIKAEDGKWHTRQVHRLVAEAFIPNPNGLPIINHKDENRQNNRADNLEWCTVQYNNTYGNAIAKKKKALKGRIGAGRMPVMGKKINDEKWTTYHSIAQASQVLGIDDEAVRKVCRGMQNTTHGYVFKFVNPDDPKRPLNYEET